MDETTRAELAPYLLPTGYYDDKAIRLAAGVEPLNAFFASFFSHADAEPGTPPEILPAPWDRLLAAATAYNDARYREHVVAREAEARQLMSAPEPWPPATWRRLEALGYASHHTEERGEYQALETTWFLDHAGEQLRSAQEIADV